MNRLAKSAPASADRPAFRPEDAVDVAGGSSVRVVNTMANKTSKKSAKIAKKAAVKRVAAKRAKLRKVAPKSQSREVAKPTLLAGGNPQIAKADGDAPVQTYIAAMPGWKRNVGRRLDALIVRTVPGVRKAVKWNSPFYGNEGQGWFLSYHCFTRYIKVKASGGVGRSRRRGRQGDRGPRQSRSGRLYRRHCRRDGMMVASTLAG